jgi:hypothetical protein
VTEIYELQPKNLEDYCSIPSGVRGISSQSMKNKSETDTGSCVKVKNVGVFVMYPLRTPDKARVILIEDARDLPQSIQ